jgi:predicted AAA+ superfamily ATPase
LSELLAREVDRADLNAVHTGDAPPIYGDASMFFDGTYPTFRMKELGCDVLGRQKKRR